ncbi:universal stress protein [Methanohalophilus profundi]|uniref:universal stress protein n=1 Tax=Methanohalophilus profundi TaxID=2138083 RepID=UPI0013EBF70B|nr:universal stress protein [Methanohalophilus profundi]
MKDITYRNILVPIDETKLSKKVIDNALHIASVENGRIIVIYVEGPSNLKSFPDEFHEKLADLVIKSIEANLEYARKQAEIHGIEIHTRVVGGSNPGREIINIAQKSKVDLTVMGTESLRSDPFGSLTRWLIAADIGPVLVITAGD